MADAEVLTEAQKLYQEALDAQLEQRQQMVEDLEFSDPSNPRQWDEVVKRQREGDPGGKRPCLVMDQTGQYIANVAGQVESQPPALHAIPVGGGAEKQAAEQIDGRFRHIEYASRAQQHYARALTSAARPGVGYLIVRPEYVDRALNWQEPRISSEADPLKVVLDPWSTETDGSDAQFAFLLDPISDAEFERRWPGKDKVDFGQTQAKTNDTRKSVVVAEQWIKVKNTKKVFVYTDSTGEEVSGSEDEYVQAYIVAAQGAEPVALPYRTYNDHTQIVKWRRMSGADVLEETEYPAEDIGVVPVYGYIGFADGRMKYCGIPRRARSAQQAYNYHISEQLAYIATAPKAPWLTSKRAIKGVEPIWDNASIQNRANLPFNDLDENGPIATPQRTNVAVATVNHEAGAAQALRDLQASIGMYQANIGADSNVTSGVAYDSQKQQGEASTAHFPSHMAASLAQVGKIVKDMDARLSDTKRKQPIIGIDGSAGSVTVDPNQASAFQRTEDGVSINPKVGKYGVRVTVGASYATQRKETNAAFAEIMRGNPAMAQVVAPFWAQTLDFPGSDKFAQAMAAMAPPPVKAILQPEGHKDGPDPAQLAQQVQQLQQAIQQATGIAHETQQELDETHGEMAKLQLQLADKTEADETARYNAETNRLKVTGANMDQIQAIVYDLVNQMLSTSAQLPGDRPQQQSETPQQEMQEPPAEQQAEALPGAAPEIGGPPEPQVLQQPAPEALPQ